jgi:hypothetical protein
MAEMTEIVLFVDSNFGSLHTHIYESTPDSRSLGGVGISISGTWNGIVSSFVIKGGVWKSYKDGDLHSQQGNPHGLGPGRYPDVQLVGIDNDSLSSVRLV